MLIAYSEITTLVYFFMCVAYRTSLYDARARERRRLIEEQEALASQLLHQVSLGASYTFLTVSDGVISLF